MTSIRCSGITTDGWRCQRTIGLTRQTNGYFCRDHRDNSGKITHYINLRQERKQIDDKNKLIIANKLVENIGRLRHTIEIVLLRVYLNDTIFDMKTIILHCIGNLEINESVINEYHSSYVRGLIPNTEFYSQNITLLFKKLYNLENGLMTIINPILSKYEEYSNMLKLLSDICFMNDPFSIQAYIKYNLNDKISHIKLSEIVGICQTSALIFPQIQEIFFDTFNELNECKKKIISQHLFNNYTIQPVTNFN